MNRLLAIAILFLVAFVPVQHHKATNQVERLVLVYLDADNNLYSFGLSDLKEMTEASWNTSIAKVIVLFDGSNIGDTKLYEVYPGGYKEISAPRLPSEADMGDPALLREFILWGIRTYHPVYVFVDLRDHGGARSGACIDDSNNDMLTIKEIRDAIYGLPITILGFDACLMGNMESLYELSEAYRGLVIASTLTEPGDGRDYHRLNVFNSSVSPYDVAKSVVDHYAAYYNTTQVTLAVYDLSLIDVDAKRINDMALRMLLDGLSMYSLVGSYVNKTTVRSVKDSIAGDGSATVHVGTNSTARKAYTVYLEANKTYDVVLDRSTNADLDLYVFPPGAPLDPHYAYAVSFYNQPEEVTFKAPVSGNRTIVVDHYSAETTETEFTLTVSEINARSLTDLLTAPDVYGPLKAIDALMNVTFVRYSRGITKLSITAGNPADLYVSLGDYENLAFSLAAPYRAELLKLIVLNEAERVSASVSMSNATIDGINTVVSISVSSDKSLELRLYNEVTGERVKRNSTDLHELPMFPYIAYLVDVQDGKPVGALRLGEGYFGGKPVIEAPSVIGVSANVSFSGITSYPNGTLNVYLNGSLVESVNVTDHRFSISLVNAFDNATGTYTLSLLSANATVEAVKDSEGPKANVEFSKGRISIANITAEDNVAIKSVEVYLDGVLAYSLNDLDEISLSLTLNVSAVFERHVTVVVKDYTGSGQTVDVAVYYGLLGVALENQTPKVIVSYTLENTTMILNVTVIDDDPEITLNVYVNGTLKLFRNVYANDSYVFQIDLGYGTFNVTVTAEDPYGLTGSWSEVVSISQPQQPTQPSGGEETSGGVNRILIIAVIAIIAILLAVLLLRRR